MIFTKSKVISCIGKKLVLETDANIEQEILRQKIYDAEIRFDDGRTITSDQRKKAYALIGEISRWSGFLPEEAKEWLKFYFTSEYGQFDYFSLSDCSVTSAREFISYLVEFCLKNNVPCREPLMSLADDIDKYLYSCLANKRCCICGQPSDFHHCEGSRIGMGRDREEIPLLNAYGMALCRKHHTECHTIGEQTFNNKYHVYGIKVTESLLQVMKG